ncbi:hypothetical protein [Deinococcus marmoris]|uniref:hypothetical protein n=1 Tax=Deinococcus marmoris TaxID=249408 RepID=UPI00138E50C7|nr:hypothetical protein [Deinococcus marmoris]
MLQSTLFIRSPYEQMLALRGDSIVQDPANPDDTYHVDAVAFKCTYEVLEAPAKP